jgi:hypothetical protein
MRILDCHRVLYRCHLQWGQRAAARSSLVPPSRPEPHHPQLRTPYCSSPPPPTPAHPSEGSHVDWFVILKHSGNTSYLYADSSDPVLATSVHSLGSKTVGAVANTLVPALSANYALYNDEVPDDGTERQKGGGGHCSCVFSMYRALIATRAALRRDADERSPLRFVTQALSPLNPVLWLCRPQQLQIRSHQGRSGHLRRWQHGLLAGSLRATGVWRDQRPVRGVSAALAVGQPPTYVHTLPHGAPHPHSLCPIQVSQHGCYLRSEHVVRESGGDRPQQPRGGHEAVASPVLRQVPVLHSAVQAAGPLRRHHVGDVRAWAGRVMRVCGGGGAVAVCGVCSTDCSEAGMPQPSRWTSPASSTVFPVTSNGGGTFTVRCMLGSRGATPPPVSRSPCPGPLVAFEKPNSKYI